eukprot:CAMPEP_0185015318 /NCGR_PEP_ID=MMETSP1098-20130426/99771_1 /TAXON_ID=89044 /ORGANISM="Spumella elongata, Strain CCAP 955/1" /LENGTH=1114 /DNA_ID=CAMNT_0027544441 /DNA_START=92 /DNA_END=3437 /DNA_ORIENTATION=-
MSYYNQPFSSSLPPPPMEAPPKPPRRVSTVMSPGNVQFSTGSEDSRPPMMKRLTRVLSTRRMSAGTSDDANDPCVSCHIDALYGRIGIVTKAINRDNGIVIQPFSFSATSLLSPEEEDNEFYIPPPALPKLVRLTLKKPVEIMTLDQRWLLQHAFAGSTLLHYACAGDQYEVAKLLLEKGADWTIVNGSNKTAEMYTVDERVRDLFANAEDRYTPYSAIKKQPTPTPTQDSPVTASPPSILKRANSSRRRQSVVNDSGWADTNLRATVHQAQILNIRPTNSPLGNSPTPSVSASAVSSQQSPTNTTGMQSRRPTLAAKSRPEPEDYEENDTESAPPSRSLTRMKSDMGSMYSKAEVINTVSELEFDQDLMSIASHNSGGTANTNNSNRKRLSFRRGSRIVQSLREKDPPPAPVASTAPAVRAPPPPPPPSAVESNPASAATSSSQSRKSIKSMKKLLADEVISLASSTTAQSARPLPAPPAAPAANAHRVPPPPSPSTSNNKINDTLDGDAGEESTTASRKSLKSKRGSNAVRHPPPPPASTDAANDNTKRASSKRTKAETAPEPVTPPPPPIRVMRRLSVNMSAGAVEAASYIEGADGTQLLSTSILGADSPDKSEPKKIHTASPEAKMSPSEVKPSGSASKTKPSVEPVAHLLRNLTLSELEDPPPPPASTDAANDNTKRASSKRTKAETSPEPVTPPPPPIRVMRRLSVNMTAGAVEAASYIEGADGTQLLSTSILGSDSPDKSEPKIIHTASPESKASPSEVKPSGSASKSKPSVEPVAHLLRNLTLSELGEASYQEAWETKAVSDTTSESPLAKLQSSMKTGADDGLWEANRLIARAAQMEKAEAREAKYHQAKAERLQGLLSKLTPLENIASGVLLKGRSAEELSRDNILDSADLEECRPDLSHHQVGGSLAATLFGGTDTIAPAKDNELTSAGQSSAEKKNSSHSPSYLQTGGSPASGARSVPAREPFHSLSFRDMIWHRAAQHMNSALSDKQRSHYDKARLEAYQLGVKLMKKEFSTMANQEHWEAVDLVEAQRHQAAERQLKENVRAYMLTNHDVHDTPHVTFTPTVTSIGAGESILEQIGGRNSSFVPFARSSVSTLFCDEESD